uniref:Uncharacterized protein n=1 Tax=Arundo donax TaxID=35708 RepID=A0A0A9A965_ARUDO
MFFSFTSHVVVNAKIAVDCYNVTFPHDMFHRSHVKIRKM